MKTLNIACLGGCINNQKDIPFDKLYHQQLKQQLEVSSNDVTISTGTYLSFSALDFQAKRLIEKSNADVLIIYLRPFALMPLVKPLVKYEMENGAKKMAIHPALSNRKSDVWPTRFVSHQSNNNYVFTNRKRMELRDFNLMCGITLGLKDWAMKFIADKIAAIQTMCNEREIKLIIISPSRNPESLLGNYICRRTANYFHYYCGQNSIDYINFNQLSNQYFTSDGVHINELAHAALGNLLMEKIKSFGKAEVQRTVFQCA